MTMAHRTTVWIIWVSVIRNFVAIVTGRGMPLPKKNCYFEFRLPTTNNATSPINAKTTKPTAIYNTVGVEAALSAADAVFGGASVTTTSVGSGVNVGASGS